MLIIMISTSAFSQPEAYPQNLVIPLLLENRNSWPVLSNL